MLIDDPPAPVTAPLDAPTGEDEATVVQPEIVSLGDRVRGRLFAWTAAIVLTLCFEIDQLRALFGYSRSATDEDQTLLWFAGRQLAHLHFHEPNFYGQNYNTVFEAIPGELFHLLGVSLALASPLGVMLMGSACWLVLAWAAHRRGHQLAAAAALALPVCMSVPYLLLLDAPRGVLSGDLLGAVAIAAAVAIRRPTLRLAVLIAVGGLAIVWDNAMALAVLPALAATTVSGIRSLRDRPARTVLAAGGALLVPVAWWLLDHVWYLSHPAYLTAKSVNTKLQVSVLATNLSHPNRLFGFYEPELWRHPAVAVLAIAILLILAIVVSFAFRRPEAAAAALTFLAVLLLILSVRDTLDVHPDLYLSGSRFLLPMPIGLWVVLHFSLSAARHRHRDRAAGRRRLDPRVPMAAIVLMAAASMIVSQARFTSEIHAVTTVDAGAHPVIPVLNPTALLAQCAAVTGIYRDARAQLLVTGQRDVAYACAAESGVNTLDTDYDRRGWLLRAAAIRPVRRILIQGWTCRSLAPGSGACLALGDRTVLLRTRPRPASVSLALAGIPIRGATRSP
jgi:hypothetical protein